LDGHVTDGHFHGDLYDDIDEDAGAMIDHLDQRSNGWLALLQVAPSPVGDTGSSGQRT
jgi:hypothetical protein